MSNKNFLYALLICFLLAVLSGCSTPCPEFSCDQCPDNTVYIVLDHFVVLPALEKLDADLRNQINTDVLLDACDKEVIRLFPLSDNLVTGGSAAEVWLNENNMASQPNDMIEFLNLSNFSAGDYIIQTTCLDLELDDSEVSIQLKMQLFDIEKRQVIFKRIESRTATNNDIDLAVLYVIKEATQALGRALESELNVELNFSDKLITLGDGILKKEKKPELKTVTEVAKQPVSPKPKPATRKTEATFVVEYYPKAPDMGFSCRGKFIVKSNSIEFISQCGNFRGDPKKMTPDEYGVSSVNFVKNHATIFLKLDQDLFYILPVADSGDPLALQPILASLKTVIGK
ncbi:MAG: hypothetical protein B6244_14255 [Candidatus Cloacimonetes bacterium 4572_55]|nr:MAG: hypothetical protein B6244_14255 [Candidatus Cloacimonetes bacterium 4572_55]